MKKYNTISVLLRLLAASFAMLLCFSCDNTADTALRLDSDNPSVRIEDGGARAVVSVDGTGGSVLFNVYSGAPWDISGSAAEWISTERTENVLAVLIDRFISEDGSTRSSSVVLAGEGGNQAIVEIEQAGQSSGTVMLSSYTEYISCRGGQSEVQVVSVPGNPIDLTVTNSIVNWLSADYDPGRSMITLSADMNFTGENLSADIIVSSGKGIDYSEAVLHVEQYSGKMILDYKTSVTGTVVMLPVSGDIIAEIDWGDGEKESYNETVPDYILHWYENPGTYRVSIDGTFEALSCNYDSRWTDYLERVVQWGDNSIVSLDSAFAGCRIVEIPEPDICSFERTVSAAGMFEDCTRLVSVPAGFFDGAYGIVDFSAVFSGCTALTGESPYSIVDGTKIHLYERGFEGSPFAVPENSERAFAGCLGLSDYNNIPENWK